MAIVRVSAQLHVNGWQRIAGELTWVRDIIYVTGHDVSFKVVGSLTLVMSINVVEGV